MNRPKILVTGTGATGVGAGVIRCLHMAGWEVHAVCADPFSWGLYTAESGSLVPWADDPLYLPRLIEVAEREKVAAVIPGTEAETVLLAHYAWQMPVPPIVNDPQLMHLMQDKVQAQQKLAELGLPVIPTYAWEDGADAAHDHGFPLVVKPSLNSSGSRGVHLVKDFKQFAALHNIIDQAHRPIVQPYIGDAGSEYTVGVMSHTDGTVAGSIVIRRHLGGLSLLTQHDDGAAVSTGFSQGFVVTFPAMQAFCETLATSLGSRGPLNIQLRIHRGNFYVFEIHPRFSFSEPIRAAAGFNAPDMGLRHILNGERLHQPTYRHDMAAIRTFDHILIPASDLAQ